MSKSQKKNFFGIDFLGLQTRLTQKSPIPFLVYIGRKVKFYDISYGTGQVASIDLKGLSFPIKSLIKQEELELRFRGLNVSENKSYCMYTRVVLYKITKA